MSLASSEFSPEHHLLPQLLEDHRQLAAILLTGTQLSKNVKIITNHQPMLQKPKVLMQNANLFVLQHMKYVIHIDYCQCFH